MGIPNFVSQKAQGRRPSIDIGRGVNSGSSSCENGAILRALVSVGKSEAAAVSGEASRAPTIWIAQNTRCADPSLALWEGVGEKGGS